jgi:hypothetical protein
MSRAVFILADHDGNVAVHVEWLTDDAEPQKFALSSPAHRAAAMLIRQMDETCGRASEPTVTTETSVNSEAANAG